MEASILYPKGESVQLLHYAKQVRLPGEFLVTFLFLGKRTLSENETILRGKKLFTPQGNVRHCLSGLKIIRCLTHRELMDYLDVFFKSSLSM